MRPLLWGLVFITVLLLFNPGVDVTLLHTPALALVMGSLAIVMSWLAAVKRTVPVRSTGRPLRPSAPK